MSLYLLPSARDLCRQANNLLDVFPDNVISKLGFQKLKLACCIFVAAVPIVLASSAFAFAILRVALLLLAFWRVALLLLHFGE